MDPPDPTCILLLVAGHETTRPVNLRGPQRLLIRHAGIAAAGNCRHGDLPAWRFAGLTG